MAWNYETVPESLTNWLTCHKVPGGGKAFVAWLQQLKTSVGITGRLGARVKPEHIPRLVRKLPRQTFATRPIRALQGDEFLRRCSRRRHSHGPIEDWYQRVLSIP